MIKYSIKLARYVAPFCIAAFPLQCFGQTQECKEGDQFRYLATDVEGEEILMYSTCLFDSEVNAYQWYRSSFDPLSRPD
jgi:hypothetical protein